MSLEGRTAVVTGGSRGIGRAVCLKLAEQGADIVFSYVHNEEAARETLQAVKELGARAVALQGDVSESESVQKLIDTAMEHFGRIDILVNNAGITRDGLVMRMKEEDFDSVMQTNTKGAFLCMKAVSRIMLKQKYGRIVNLSSVVALHGNAGQVNYAASKAAVIGMTKSLAKELGAKGITVNAVAPGFITTDMTAALGENAQEAVKSSIPMKRLGKPENIASAVAFLVSGEAEYITGQVLAVDGGMSM